MKETIIDMILQFFGKNKDDKALPAPLLELLVKLKSLHDTIAPEEMGIEQPLQDSKFIQVKEQSEHATRFYTVDEYHRLGMEGLRLLRFLESNQIIDEIIRERVVQMAMESENKRIDLDNLKCTILLILNEQSPSRLYMEWLKYLFFNTTSSAAH